MTEVTALPKKACREILKDCAATQRLAQLYDYRTRHDLTPEQRAEALRIGRIQFASAGARREK